MDSRSPARLRVVLGAALLVLGLARNAHAEPSAAERETARSLMDEADALRRSGDLAAALERYRAADQLMHVPTTGLEVARAQAELAQLVEASATALEVANSPPRPNEPAVFAEARQAAQHLADELRARIPALSIRVEPWGTNYQLSFDGVRVPDATHGLPFKLNPGKHHVLVQAVGFQQISEQIELAEAQVLEREFTLMPAASPPPSLVVAPPPAAVAKAAPVAHRDPGAAARTRGYIALSIGGALFAAGVTTGIVAVAKSNDVKGMCDGDRCPRQVEPELNTANTLANVSNVTLALGLLTVGYGVLELLNAEDAVQLSATGTGVRVTGAL